VVAASPRRSEIEAAHSLHHANKLNGTIYAGVTSDLTRRAFSHRERLVEGFTRRYGCRMRVYYEHHEDTASAIQREKQIKAPAEQKW